MCFAPQRRALFRHAKHCVFPMIWGSGGSKSRLAKVSGAEPAGQMRDEKLHTVVARSIFGSQNVKNTRGSDNFWKLRCRKSARRCGAKHISKSKCTKHTSFGPLLAVEMLKKCTPLWHEAHFQVKMYKTPHVRATFGGSDVEKVHAVVARRTFPSQNVKNTRGSDHYSFSSTLLSSDISLLSASSLLCFSSVHIVGSLTSKLPSMIYMHNIRLATPHNLPTFVQYGSCFI